MIKSYSDYVEYLKADRISLSRKLSFRSLLLDDVWKFQIVLRTYEYLTNCSWNIIIRSVVYLIYRRLGTKIGVTIPLNVFGPGLSIAHPGTLIVNSNAKIGANCRVHACVNIGTKAGVHAASPTIGQNCYIGPGAKLFGPIVLGDNVAIGANAVVNKSFPDGNCTLGGIPAQVISEQSSCGLLIEGFDSSLLY